MVTRAKANDSCSLRLHLVSESTGSLARHIASVVLPQFPKLIPEITSHIFCDSAAKLRDAKSQIAEDQTSIVFSALTQPKLIRSLKTWCERRRCVFIDLIGHVVNEVAQVTSQRPLLDASKSHRCDDDYLRRIDAWEFTLQHDDSRRLETISEADIVLLGVSRVGKTPLAAYLGSIGYRVANVSIAKDVPVPSEVVSSRDKTIGLTISVDRLAEIRKRRFELNRFSQALRSRGTRSDYCSLSAILDEIDYAEKQFRRLRLRTLDTTELTVEEAAARVLQLLAIEQT